MGSGGAVSRVLNGHAQSVYVSTIVTSLSLIVAVYALPWASAKDLDRVEVALSNHQAKPMHDQSISDVADIKARLKALESAQVEMKQEIRATRQDIGIGFRSITERLDQQE